MSADSSTGWINLIPSVSIGDSGHTFGYYVNVAQYIIIVPLVLLVLTAIAYNIAVGLATNWMYKHAWKHSNSGGKNIIPKYSTLIWEEIYTVNIKVANYFLGNSIVIKEDGDHLVLQIHDYTVYMPLAMVMIQVSQFAVAMVLVILFFDFLVLQVSHICNPYHAGVDCFDATETDHQATPLPCDNTTALDEFNITNVTCFHLSLNPVIAASVAGGFLKMAPHIFFSTLSYQYIRFLNITQYCKCKCSTKSNNVCHILCAILAVLFLLSAGIIVLIVVIKVPVIYDITFTANPVRHLTIIFCFIGYFMMSGFVWSILPLQKVPQRFCNLVYRRMQKNPFEDTGMAVKGSSEKLHPWVVVDESESTNKYHLLDGHH